MLTETMFAACEILANRHCSRCFKFCPYLTKSKLKIQIVKAFKSIKWFKIFFFSF